MASVHVPGRAGALVLAALASLALSCAGVRPPPDPDDPPYPTDAPRTGIPAEQNPFVHAVGRDLVDGSGDKVQLRGIALGNQVWGNPSTPPTLHHSEADFRKIRGLGMNAVRFYLNYGIFEDDAAPYRYKERGFEWLAENLAWARANGIYVVLNVHVPQGGYQSFAGGRALWEVRENRRRFTALWKEIARRCKDEPIVAGYGLLNEPVAASSPEQWETLAKTTVAAIREVDPRHAIFVERLYAVIGSGPSPDWNEDRNGDMNFFLVNDTNVVYEFHFYKPHQFTHQRASLPKGLADVRTTYPGPFTDWDRTPRIADRAYLEREMTPYLAFGKRYGVPVFLGEFGVVRFGYEPGRNGTGWVSDVIDFAMANGVSHIYHAYHEWAFGLYGSGDNLPPGELNQPLADLFAEKYR